jgi:hypothetical protein
MHYAALYVHTCSITNSIQTFICLILMKEVYATVNYYALPLSNYFIFM